jgi:hypothetical protein
VSRPTFGPVFTLSSLKVEVLTPAADDAYERHLARHEGALLYQSPRYRDFLAALLGCRAHYLAAVKDGEIVGSLPLMYLDTPEGRVYNSLPYYGSNGGVLAESPEASAALAAEYNAMARAPGTLSATVIGNPLGAPHPAEIVREVTDYRIGQLTALPAGAADPWSELMAAVDPSARRNVRKAREAGVTVETDAGATDVLRRMHHENITAVGGAPKSERFFALYPRHFRDGSDYRLWVARREGVVVAALLAFYWGRTAEYFTPATDAGHRSSQAMPLIVMTAMADAARRGYRWWNWGGTWPSQVGVHRFKRKWAAVDHRYEYLTALNDPSLLERDPAALQALAPGFFVVPFHALKGAAAEEST